MAFAGAMMTNNTPNDKIIDCPGAAPRLLDWVRGLLRLTHYSVRTEQAYQGGSALHPGPRKAPARRGGCPSIFHSHRWVFEPPDRQDAWSPPGFCSSAAADKGVTPAKKRAPATNAAQAKANSI